MSARTPHSIPFNFNLYVTSIWHKKKYYFTLKFKWNPNPWGIRTIHCIKFTHFGLYAFLFFFFRSFDALSLFYVSGGGAGASLAGAKISWATLMMPLPYRLPFKLNWIDIKPTSIYTWHSVFSLNDFHVVLCVRPGVPGVSTHHFHPFSDCLTIWTQKTLRHAYLFRTHSLAHKTASTWDAFSRPTPVALFLPPALQTHATVEWMNEWKRREGGKKMKLKIVFKRFNEK